MAENNDLIPIGTPVTGSTVSIGTPITGTPIGMQDTVTSESGIPIGTPVTGSTVSIGTPITGTPVGLQGTVTSESGIPIGTPVTGSTVSIGTPITGTPVGLQGVNDAINTVNDTYTDLSGNVSSITGTVGGLTNSIDNITDSFNNIGSGTLGTISGTIDSFKDGDILDNIDNLQNIGGAITGTIDGLKNDINSTKDLVTGVIGDVQTGVGAITSTIGALQNIGSELGEFAEDLFYAGVGAVTSTIGALIDVGEYIIDETISIGRDILDFGEGVYDSIFGTTNANSTEVSTLGRALSTTLLSSTGGYSAYNISDDPMIRTHPVSFFTSPTNNVMDYIFNAVLSNEFKSSIASETDALSLKSMSNFVAKETFKSSFLDVINKEVRNVTTQKLSFNIESTIGNLQQERNMQPTFVSGLSGATFNATFNEVSSLVVTKTLLLWFQYIKGVNEGSIIPPINYILNNIVDYKVSVYTFHLKPNMKEILFFSKYTGVFPINVPIDAFTADADNMSEIRLEAEFSFDSFECLNPILIDEFNIITGSSTQKILKDATTGNFAFKNKV